MFVRTCPAGNNTGSAKPSDSTGAGRDDINWRRKKVNCCAQLCFDSGAKIMKLKNIHPIFYAVASIVRKKMLKNGKCFCCFE